jgi:hypothetical protein
MGLFDMYPHVPTGPMHLSIFKTDVPWGVYDGESERYERIFLERRAHNQAGHMPRRKPAIPEAVRQAERPEPVRKQQAERKQKAFPPERKQSLEEMARVIGAKRRST